MPPLHSPSSPPRRVFKKNVVFIPVESNMFPIHSVASSFGRGGEKKKVASLSVLSRRLRGVSVRGNWLRAPPAAPDPGLLFSVSGKLWQVEPLSAVILPRTVVSPPLFIHNGSVELQPGLFAPSLPGRVEPVAGKCLAAKGGKVLSHPESQPRCCLNFSASVQARRRVLLARR